MLCQFLLLCLPVVAMQQCIQQCLSCCPTCSYGNGKHEKSLAARFSALARGFRAVLLLAAYLCAFDC